MYCDKCGNEAGEEAKFCWKCGESLVKENVEYLAITPKRLIVLSILTLGLYELYWFYKNWQAVKNAERTDILPLWRALFSVFFCYGLFKRIINSAVKKGYEAKYSAKNLTIIYVTFFIIGIFWDGTFALSANLVLLPVSLFTLWPLVILQKAANFNNSQINPNFTTDKKFSRGEITLIAIGVALLLFSLFVAVFPSLDPLGEKPEAASIE